MIFSEDYIKALCGKAKPRKPRLGIMYMGGKGELAKKIVDAMLPADVFVDCFGGGGSVALEAMLSGKYKKVVYNELEPLIYEAFQCAVTGSRSGTYPRFVGKEEYFKLDDGVLRVCFSWNGCWWKYAYQERHVRLLEGMHNFVCYNDSSLLVDVLPDLQDDFLLLDKLCYDFDTKRTSLQKLVSNYLGQRGEFGENWKEGTSSIRLLHLERWNRIEATSNVCKESDAELVVVNGDYKDALSHVSGTAVVYCDPPYKGTYGYNDKVFEHDDFMQWFKELSYPAYLSEKLEVPELVKVLELTNHGRIAYNVKHFDEYLYWNGR